MVETKTKARPQRKIPKLSLHSNTIPKLKKFRTHTTFLLGLSEGKKSHGPNSEGIDLRFETRNGGLHDFSLEREICKLVLELDFRANGIMATLSEFGLDLLG